MRPIIVRSGSDRPSAWATVLAVLLVLLAAPTASARSVSDPDIGWPTALRKELRLPKVASAKPCNREPTRAGVRRQSRIAGSDEPIRRILRHGPANLWGHWWFLPCDGGRLQVGVASGGSARDTRAAVRDVRRYLRKKRLTRDVRLVAVRSTYRQLQDQVSALSRLAATFAEPDLVSAGVDTARNAVEAEIEHQVSDAERERLREFARTSPVNVLLRFEPAPDPNAPVGTYAATFVLDRAAVDRSGRRVTVTVDDPSCAADETNDTAERFAGVRVRKLTHAYELTARIRESPERDGVSTCEANIDPRTSVTTTVTLPGRLGRRGIVDGALGPSDYRFVVLPPIGVKAIRSLVPKYIYSGGDCDTRDVRRAFRGREKTEWCFF